MNKKNYTVFKNIIFTHKYILHNYLVRYCLFAVIIVLFNVLTTFMLTLLPAYTVNLLIKENTIKQILLKLTFYFLILYISTILYKRIEKSFNNKVNMSRMSKCLDYYDNIMLTSYINIDTAEGRKIFNSGLNSYMDAFHEGFTHMVVDFRTLLQSIFGLIVYCLFIATCFRSAQ